MACHTHKAVISVDNTTSLCTHCNWINHSTRLCKQALLDRAQTNLFMLMTRTRMFKLALTR